MLFQTFQRTLETVQNQEWISRTEVLANCAHPMRMVGAAVVRISVGVVKTDDSAVIRITDRSVNICKRVLHNVAARIVLPKLGTNSPAALCEAPFVRRFSNSHVV